MASLSRRSARWPLSLFLLAALPVIWCTAPARAEHRKFLVILADPPKDHAGSSLTLPNRADVWDAYFDTTKNSTNPDTGARVESFAEWWEQVSYGDVTVSGDVYGWFSLPWSTSPADFDGDTSYGSSSVIPHVELRGGFTYNGGQSAEGFSNAVAKFKYDFDGVGENPTYGNAGDRDIAGAGQTDQYGSRVFTPGERFMDVNGNGIYDAGVSEWAIDKNGDGQIDLSREATSYANLFAADITYPEEGDPVFNGYTNNTEWFDSNGNGTLDWGGTEIWIDRNGDGQLGDRATAEEDDRPATLLEFLIQVNDPEEDSVEWYDEQWNDNFDYPEPFEDYLRRWSASSHDFIPVSDEYIEDNFPGDTDFLIARIGNGLYNSPDRWSNYGNVNSSNKAQETLGILADAAEQSEQQRRWQYATGGHEYGEPAWLAELWQYRYGTGAPDWDYTIPYLRVFNPVTPIPPLRSGADNSMPFEPNRGGPFNNGDPYSGEAWDATIKPDPGNADEGFWDGPAEYDDLASSIYHQAGDQNIGEITSPSNNKPYGQDIGAGDPVSVAPDGWIPAASPLAFNVHGDGGYDAGNVLTTEFLTWRTDGQSSTDIGLDIDGDGTLDRISAYHRDINLDGLIDLGETPGAAGEFGLPVQTVVYNYGVDADPGTPPNGGPEGEYPFSRIRLTEDCVAALDDSVDWDNFLNGPPPWGNAVSGVILLPDGTATGMFSLPASGFFGIRTRDIQDSGATGPDRYTPISFFDGLGISLAAGQGEANLFDAGNTYHTAFSAHEYGHTWEGYPDLYDYDVYRQSSGFAGAIINNPVARWCVMSGGGLVHPVPILKADSGWLTPVDITRELVPVASTTITFQPWEFSRRRTVYVYQNPLYDGEEFYFWRNSLGIESFDKRHPGEGLLIMHVDRIANPEGLPIQQRLGSHFTYEIVEADGLQNLANGENMGDAGDPWPGESNAVLWNGGTDPSNRWWDGQACGLQITAIDEQEDQTDVTFYWSPRELPTFAWIQPPGGISVNGIYQLRYRAYDQFGGTAISFYATESDLSEQDPGYDNGILLNATPETKAAGEILGAYGADVSMLEDGKTYTFYARLDPGVGDDGRRENSYSDPRANINNSGTGVLSITTVDTTISKLEVWTVTVVDDTTAGSESWQVIGSISGTQEGRPVTGVPYSVDADENGNSPVSFTIQSGAIPFSNGDQFAFVTTGLTAHSTAVLVDDGEVVEPEPPVATLRVDGAVTSGLAPFEVTFFHSESYDPHDAALTFTWDFGDSSTDYSTIELDRSVTHTFETAGTYNVTLTVTNAFGLSDTDEIEIRAQQADPPTIRIDASPTIGPSPLEVTFSAERTTDSNPGTQNLDYVWDFGDDTEPSLDVRTDHVFADPGTYVATLTVTNRPYGESATDTVEIRVTGTAADLPPTADFDVDVRSGKAPLTVTFDGRTSSDPEGGALTYEWNFGDGTTSEDADPLVEHTFDQAGRYDATLTVTDEVGQTDAATIAIVVTADSASAGQAPVAKIVASTTQGAAPLTVTFDGRDSTDPDGGPLSYGWSFGDGSDPTEGDVVTHTFTSPGEFRVTLVVSDAASSTGQATTTILVTGSIGAADGGDGTADGGDVLPEVPTACGPGCGPAGLMPMLLTLIGVGGLRRWGRSLYR